MVIFFQMPIQLTHTTQLIRMIFYALTHSLWNRSRLLQASLVIRLFVRGVDEELFKSEILRLIVRCMGESIISILRSFRVKLTFTRHWQRHYDFFIDFCFCYINRYHTVRDWSEEGIGSHDIVSIQPSLFFRRNDSE